MNDRKSDEQDEERPRLPEEQRLPRITPASPIDTRARQTCSNQLIPPTTGNPDLDPNSQSLSNRVDLRDVNPLVPQGMLYDPRRLLEHQRPQNPGHGIGYLPPGARFDPFGPPDPSQVGPGRGFLPSNRFGGPDPDHLPPPGPRQPPNF